MSYLNLIEQFISERKLKTPAIIKAFKNVNRAQFMLPEDRQNAGVDVPFPIGEGQTISQPTTVAFMIEELKPQKDDKILDIGAGSGWTTALLAEIVGEKGEVIGVEIIGKVFEFGKNNLKNFKKYQNIKFLNCDASGGLEKYAPFDRILASATFSTIPDDLKNQLKIGGKMVAPVENSLVMIERKTKKKFLKKEFPYFTFVPITGKFS